MTIRCYVEDRDYPTLREWWLRANSLDKDPRDTLSPFGSVVFDDREQPVMAGFLYLSVGAKVCFVERCVARPGLSVRDARRAGALLFTNLRIKAQGAGYKHVFIHTERDGMEAELHRLGFTTIEEHNKLLSQRI